MNEYQIALIFSGCIAALWLCAYVLSWVGQWAWAWVDDSEIGENNWLVERFTKRTKTEVEWVYPVYLSGGDLFGYAKDQKYEGAKIHDSKRGYTLESGEHFLYDHTVDRMKEEKVARYMFKAILGSAASPVLLLVSFKLYPIAIALATVYGTAHLARYARRHKKVFDEHVKDKKAHD